MSKTNSTKDMRSPLKWPGGKRRVLQYIRQILPIDGKKRLVEPFVGGGSVFLNLDFSQFVLCDTNKDLIALYNAIRKTPVKFQNDALAYFNKENNHPERYYELRKEFNTVSDPYHRAVLFLYLNRHGYNGLCRYNQSGGYNVPFGQYKKPYFPKSEISHVAKKLKQAQLIQGDFQLAFKKLKEGDVIYCDPPYSPINAQSNFTAYSATGFCNRDQTRLVECALKAKERGISTVISNHYTEFTKSLYSTASNQALFSVQRSISQNGKQRNKVEEILALYTP